MRSEEDTGRPRVVTQGSLAPFCGFFLGGEETHVIGPGDDTPSLTPQDRIPRSHSRYRLLCLVSARLPPSIFFPPVFSFSSVIII